MSAEGEPIGYLLARIHSNMDRRANNNLKASGMTFSQMRLLHFLFKQGKATPSQKDIEDFLQVSHPAAEVDALRALLRRVLNNVLNDDGGKPC